MTTTPGMRPVRIRKPDDSYDWWDGIELVPGLAVVRKPPGEFRSDYCLTHLPTGRSVGQFDDPEQAAAAAARLASMTDWTVERCAESRGHDWRVEVLRIVRDVGGEW